MNNHLPSSTDLVIRPASYNDISFVQKIAEETWPVAYKSILGKEQLQYMLGLFYSRPALEDQLKNNHHFYLALKDAQPVGFASFSHTTGTIYKLQKLYVLPGVQGTGAGKALLNIIESVAKSMGGSQLQLNVNRQNKAQHFYLANGFSIIKSEDIDIGHGYFMNDYVMEKTLC